MLKDYLVISEEVQTALAEKKAVVALESTIISHGMPYPKNRETALACEAMVRENGAVPATTAIIDGKIRVGLSEDEIEFLSTSKDILKMSRRDMPYIVANKLNGATTVATTVITASLAGIDMMVTGGIGGVHRGAQTTFDISRDLQEIANTNICVVCAGAKSILDIGLTLEYLETFGVPVLGYQTKKMPAFYTRESEFELDFNMPTPESIAQSVRVKWDLGLNGGVLVANPIPHEYSMDSEMITKCIEDALVQAEQNHIKGKEVTPFLLDKVLKITEGKSLVSNIELVKNNARLGAKIAVALHSDQWR